MKKYENVPMKSSVPKKFGWILTRNRLLKKVNSSYFLLIPSGGARGAALGQKIDRISCERPYEMKSVKTFRCMLTRNML